MTIFVVSIYVIWKVSISIDCDMPSTWVVESDETDEVRTWRTHGTWCPLVTRTCNRAAWDVPLRKGWGAKDFITDKGAIDFITGGGASNDIDGWGKDGSGGEKVRVNVTWGRKGKSNDIYGSTRVMVDGMVVSGRGEGVGMDTLGGESGDSNDTWLK